MEKDGQGGLLLSSEQQNITCKGTHAEWDFSCFPLLTNPLLVHLYKLVTFPDCAFMWKKPGEMWTGGGGGLYYVSFTCYLSGTVMTNRDNQSLQQLFRFRIRWVGSNFFGSKRESSTNIHTIRDDFNVQTCKLRRPVTWNVMARRFWHSGWRQIQKSPSFNTKQWIVSGTCCYRAQILVYMSRSRVPNHPTHIHTCWNLLKFLKLLSSDYRQKKN